MRRDHEHEQDLCALARRGGDDGPEVAAEEEGGDGEADADEDVVEYVEGRPGDESDGDPDEVGVAVEGPGLEEGGGRVGGRVREGLLLGRGGEVAEEKVEDQRDDERVAVNETGGAWGGSTLLAATFEVFFSSRRFTHAPS